MNSSSSSSVGGAKMADKDSRPHVLIVDGDPIGRVILKAIFMRCSFKVTTAENGLQALRILGLVDDPLRSGDDPVDRVIIDYETPTGMTGIELVKKIKESPATKHLPVDFVSSAGDLPPETSECTEAGADSIINKFFIGVFAEMWKEEGL